MFAPRNLSVSAPDWVPSVGEDCCSSVRGLEEGLEDLRERSNCASRSCSRRIRPDGCRLRLAYAAVWVDIVLQWIRLKTQING